MLQIAIWSRILKGIIYTPKRLTPNVFRGSFRKIRKAHLTFFLLLFKGLLKPRNYDTLRIICGLPL